tara:strand:+ start:5182 stop:6243 length:1062 start_codon:yes stop_codon:yes gene_type:complete
MRYYSGVNVGDTFAEVEHTYNGITPVVSKNIAASTDLRPIGRRANVHEYIKKFGPNCYAICVAVGRHSATRYDGHMCEQHISDADQLRGAPIVWRRLAGNRESLTIHNGTHGQEIGRYGVLNSCLPRNVSFGTNNGMHTVYAGGERFILPLNRHIPASRMVASHDKNGYGSTPRFERKVAFEREIGSQAWELTSERYAASTHRAIVDVEAKAALRNEIGEFKAWFTATMPLFADRTPRSLWVDADADFKVFAAEANAPTTAYTDSLVLLHDSWDNPAYTQQLRRDVVATPDHPLRLAMGIRILAEMLDQEDQYILYPAYNAPAPDESPEARAKRDKRRLNALMNRALNLKRKT